MLAASDNQTVQMLVRRGGGGSNGYESLSNTSLDFTAGQAWMRHAFVFQATGTVNVKDPLTLDLGARLDFQQVQPGRWISIANAEIVPVTAVDTTTRADLLLNTTATGSAMDCPVAQTLPRLCAQYVRLSDNAPVAWPYYLPARSSEIVYARDASLIDSDGDGIADAQDACAGTTAGRATNSRGCALGQ